MPVLFLDIFQKDLFGGVRDETFHRFLEVCFSHATCFSLSRTFFPGYELVPNAAERALSAHLKKTIAPRTWYGYDPISEKMVQCIYSANPDTMQTLKQYYDDIFLRNQKRLPKVPLDTVGWKPKRVSTLENLCFFSGCQMILGTLSHERICSTNVIDTEFTGQLMKAGNWRVKERPEFGIDQVRI